MITDTTLLTRNIKHIQTSQLKQKRLISEPLQMYTPIYCTADTIGDVFNYNYHGYSEHWCVYFVFFIYSFDKYMIHL